MKTPIHFDLAAVEKMLRDTAEASFNDAMALATTEKDRKFLLLQHGLTEARIQAALWHARALNDQETFRDVALALGLACRLMLDNGADNSAPFGAAFFDHFFDGLAAEPEYPGLVGKVAGVKGGNA
jgi:hypothetical protein